jgi:hypothetical protein
MQLHDVTHVLNTFPQPVSSLPPFHPASLLQAPTGCAPDVWQQLQQHLSQQQADNPRDPQPGDEAAATGVCGESSSSSNSSTGCVHGRRSDSAVPTVVAAAEASRRQQRLVQLLEQ